MRLPWRWSYRSLRDALRWPGCSFQAREGAGLSERLAGRPAASRSRQAPPRIAGHRRFEYFASGSTNLSIRANSCLRSCGLRKTRIRFPKRQWIQGIDAQPTRRGTHRQSKPLGRESVLGFVNRPPRPPVNAPTHCSSATRCPALCSLAVAGTKLATAGRCARRKSIHCPSSGDTRYTRRQPENTVLYTVVQRELETFLARADGAALRRA